MNFKKCVLWTFSLVTLYRLKECFAEVWTGTDVRHVSPSRPMGRWWKIMYRKKLSCPRLKSQSRHCSSHHGRMQWGHERMFNWTVALGWGFPSGQPPTHVLIQQPLILLVPWGSLSLSLSISLSCTSGCVREVWKSSEGMQREVQA